jgi:transcription-repair coupling factor (superfamily II helicase)
MSFDNVVEGIKDIHKYEALELENFTGTIANINERLNKYIKDKYTVVICIKSKFRANKLINLLENSNAVLSSLEEIQDNKINIINKNITEGYIFNNYVVISEKEIFNQKETHTAYKTNFKIGNRVRDINKLVVGDYIVHNVHGIGIYRGIKTLTKNGLKKDYLMLEYKGGDKLYIPVERLELISKYSASDGFAPKLNRLGSVEWHKTKLRAKARIENIAGELLKLYAERESIKGFSFLPDGDEQLEFEKDFVYEETADQIKVIDEIKKDMEAPSPMDRLLCGDVGYGKTEVAFRAIFKAIMSGKQVALLCPTTILSSQHFNNAKERFKKYPVEIELLNRFVASGKQKKVIERLKEGRIDLLIGTHRLLSEDVKFKNLGLLIIDEEQRFGVKHKEKIKQYRADVDVLTLSATPIPRTLQMSMAGVRSLSLIETPPTNRYPIQTYVLEENRQVIKDAIYKEMSRNGQVFLLYNSIEDMESKAREINSLVPEAKIICAHGQMAKTELEDVMIRFLEREYDILLCTTIIETGIDIPGVNTLIIIDADRFGLSQLYQIRGRVGRSNKIAYCYLMYNKGKQLSDVATKRLNVIKEFTELGSGFAIAMRDLSIRGSGDILGSEQAGFVDAIGIELFLRMLTDEINRLKGHEVKEEEETDTQPLLEVSTTIDDKYVEEEDLKIEIHQKINQIQSKEDLDNIKAELEDRFGTLTEDILLYMQEELFETRAKNLGIEKIIQNKNSIAIYLPPALTENINGDQLFVEVCSLTRKFRFGMKNRQLIITLDTVTLDKHYLYYLIDLLDIIEKSIKAK